MSKINNIIPTVPGDLRRRRDEWLLDLKLELIRIVRDNGKCLNFTSGSKTMWMNIPGVSDYCIVYYTGDLYKVNLIILPGKDPIPDFKVGVDPSIFSTEKGIPIPKLLEVVEMFPANPFS